MIYVVLKVKVLNYFLLCQGLLTQQTNIIFGYCLKVKNFL